MTRLGVIYPADLPPEALAESAAAAESAGLDELASGGVDVEHDGAAVLVPADVIADRRRR